MTIQFSHTIEVPCPPAQAFALIEDLPRTPEWMANCVKLEKTTPGPNAAGQQLRYELQMGSHESTLDGSITAYQPNEKITCQFSDDMMEIVIDFQLQALDTGGAKIVHTISITPQNFMATMFAPVIKKTLPEQTVTAMEKLKALIDTNAAPRAIAQNA